MTNSIHTYGQTVIEFYPHSEEDFQSLLDKKVSQYNTRSEGLHYKGNAANVDYVRHMPLEMALIELQDILKEGYTLIKASYDALYFKAILRKPEETVTAELVNLQESTKAEYDSNRYARNVAETAQKLQTTIFNTRREAEELAAAKAATLAAKQEATEEQKAMAVLLAAYATPAQVDMQQVTP